MCTWGAHGFFFSTLNPPPKRFAFALSLVPCTLINRFSLFFYHSHGFAWGDGADTTSNILPLYHYVKNFGRTEEGGFYGK